MLFSGGAITWKNGSASANGAKGAILDNSKALAKPITVTNVGTNQNLETGLTLLSLGGARNCHRYRNLQQLDQLQQGHYRSGEYWQDNLSCDNNVWYFDANKTDQVNIKFRAFALIPLYM